ncbi:MAG: hypothetical protein JXR68_00075 [Bacteroidales bacterium]|nr:hypothetical protein [Bacteroidales bacterium]
MKKITISLIISLFLSVYTNAQNLPLFEISTMPLSYAQVNQPHLRAGIKFFPLKTIAISSDFGYGADFMYYGVNTVTNYSYFSFRPEVDFSIIRNNEYNLYIGIEYYYYKKENTLQNHTLYLKDASSISFNKADYIKQKEGLNLKLGLTIYTKSHFLMDLYSGIGYRQKFSEYTNIIQGTYYEYKTCEFCIIDNIGFVQGANLSLGIKIGFSL